MANGEPEKERSNGAIRDILWPIGGAVLGLIVFPVAIEQYPETFKESRWILPLGVSTVLGCWILPFLFDHRLRKFHSWVIETLGRRAGKVILLVVWVVAIGIVVGGWKFLYKLHSTRLESKLRSSPSTGTSGKRGDDSSPPNIPSGSNKPYVDQNPKVVAPKFIYKGWDAIPASEDKPASVRLYFLVSGGSGTIRYISRAWSAAGRATDLEHEIKMQDTFWSDFERRNKAEKTRLVAATRGDTTPSWVTIGLGPEISGALPTLKKEGGIIIVGTRVMSLDGKLMGQTCLVINVASNDAHLCSNHNFP